MQALLGNRNGLLSTRPAKVVSMSMEGSDSAEPFTRATETGSAGGSSGQAEEERGVSGRAKRRERSHQSVTQTPRQPHFSCTTTDSHLYVKVSAHTFP
jgi:hypothetical protein